MCLGLDVFDPLCFAYLFAKLYDFFVFDVVCLFEFVIGSMHLHEVCVVVRVALLFAVGWMGIGWWKLWCREGQGWCVVRGASHCVMVCFWSADRRGGLERRVWLG